MSGWGFRVITGVALLAWMGATLLLDTYAAAADLPLVAIRFASVYGVLWLISGAALIVLLIRAWTVRRTARERWLTRYETVFSHVSEGVLVCSAKGKVLWLNDAATTWLGDDAALPDTVRILVEKAHLTRRVAVQPLMLGENTRIAAQAVPLEGKTYAVILRTIPEGGRSTFYENFIRRVVHDMRNPLAAIIGHAANLHQLPASTAVPPDIEGWRTAAVTIDHQAQRLARLVDSLLFDARLAYVPLASASLDLVDVVEEAVFAHDEAAQQEGKDIEMELPSEPSRFEGDRDLLLRAFENLIVNSLKYSGADGRLCVRLEKHPSMYVIQFIDNGEGIPPEYLPDRIFEPLVRARSQESGSGLGLAIARKIVEMHSGTITAQSKLGSGTTMTIRLPITASGT